MSIAPLGNSGHFQTSITSTEINSSSAPQETAQTKQALFSLYLEEKLQKNLDELKTQDATRSLSKQAENVRQITSLLEDTLQAASPSTISGSGGLTPLIHSKLR